MKEILLSDWTLDAFKEREERRRREQQDAEAAIIPQGERSPGLSFLGEENRALIVERDRLSAELAQARLASKTAEQELIVARGQCAAALAQLQNLTAERDWLSADLARAQTRLEAVEEEQAAFKALNQKLTDEDEKIRASAERIVAQAVIWRDKLQALDSEGLLAFVKRRYLGKRG